MNGYGWLVWAACAYVVLAAVLACAPRPAAPPVHAPPPAYGRKVVGS